ncbi:SapC family protein, partial [Arthrospira platensis SPKY1]|nr:SapC family protein [Arthrospira platensis SPKY1]
FAAAQADYTIAFAKDEAGTYMSVALLGLKAEQNLFVNAQGQWQQGAYIPAYVRRFPFAPAGEGDKMVVVMETRSGVVGPFAEGEPLFDNGQPTETLQRALGLVEAFHREAQGTQAFCRWLDEQ